MQVAYAAIIFDMDGVLVDSEPVHIHAWREALEERGVSLSDEELRQSIGITTPTFAAKLEEEWGHRLPDGREGLIGGKREIFARILDAEIKPVAGAERLMNELDGAARLALCSTTGREGVESMLRRFGWLERFETLVTFGCAPRPKPHPDMYLEALRRLDLPAERALAFEDSPAGVRSAAAAGLRVAGLTTGLPAEALRASGAAATLADFDDPRLAEVLAGRE